MRRTLALAAATLVLASAAAAFFYLRPLQVEVAASQENVPIQAFGLGTVEARVLSRIGFEVGGAVVELNADHGDRVRRGDVLARLDTAEQLARVAKAQAGVTNAEATVAKAEAAVGRAQTILAQRRQANERRKSLLARRAVSEEVAEEAQLEQDVAAAELVLASTDVDLAKAALEDARAQYGMERVLLDRHELRAPYDAIVVDRRMELGAVLNPGEPLFTVMEPGTVWGLAYVDEAWSGDIRVGMPAEVRLRSLPRETFQARVVRIGIESDRVSEERRVYVACERCPVEVHLGEQIEVLVTTTVLKRAVLIPETAIDGFDGREGWIWAVEGGVLKRYRVAFGLRTLDARHEIVSGLPQAAAAVVVATGRGFREGRAARASESPTP